MQRVVMISDLHLCLGPNYGVEDFYADDAFAGFLQDRLLMPGPEDRVDLVLLGDAFDLWQTALDDAEYHADLSSEIPLDYSPHDESQRIGRVAQAHPRFFSALRAYGERPNCHVTLVIGNHDHTLIDTGIVQPKVRELVGRNVRFAPNFDRPDIGLYAEHGSQWDKNNTYEDFEHLGLDGECPGYALVRLFCNRLETFEPSLSELPCDWAHIWSRLVSALRNNPRALGAALKFWCQYKRDRRVLRKVRLLKAAAADSASLPRGDGPDILADDTARADRAFSEDPMVEQALREAYYAYPEVKTAVDDLRLAGAPPVPPADAVTAEKAMARKMFAAKLAGHDGAEQLFDVNPTGRDQPLDADTYRYVVFGHSHAAGELRLDNGALYVNTGTWAGRDRKEFPLVVAEWDGRATRLGLGVLADGQVDVNLQ